MRKGINMKKKSLLLLGVLAAMVLLATGCTKEKTCRCSVRGTSKVRIVKIEKGSCDGLSVLQYHTSVDSLKVDTLLCTDYVFDIDSVFNE